jgi:hypothetical protein
MLVQKITGAACLQLIAGTFGFGSAEPRPVGVGLFRRPFPLVAFLELLQVDQISHA